jgi:hypothetical protein
MSAGHQLENEQARNRDLIAHLRHQAELKCLAAERTQNQDIHAALLQDADKLTKQAQTLEAAQNSNQPKI